MNLRSLIVLGFVASFIILSGCTAAEQQNVSHESRGGHFIEVWEDHAGYNGYNVYKIVIPEDNVTCYLTYISSGGGMSCIKGDQI